jgi:hypothetical protein
VFPVARSTRVALALGLVAAGLRLPLALTTPFWQDEVASARILDEQTFAGVVRHVVRTESTPPLWYVLAWVVHQAGVPLYDVRLLSVAEDFVLVALVVVVAARVLPLRFAALTGGLVAVGSEFSAEGRWIRSYELFAVSTVALLLALVRACERPTAARLSLVAVVVAAGSLTHYFFLFTLAAALVWAALEPELRGTRRGIVSAAAAGLLPLAVWSPAFLAQFRHRHYGWIGSFDWREVVDTPLRLFTPDGSGTLLLAGSCVGLAAVAVGCRLLWRRGPTGRLTAVLAIAPLVLAAATWGAGVRVYAVRNMIGVGPFLAVALVSALSALPARVGRAVVPVAVLAAAAASFGWAQRAPGPAYNRIAHVLVADGWRPGDDVAVFGNRSAFRSPLEWYLPGQPLLTSTGAAQIDEPVFLVERKSASVVRLDVHELRLPRGATLFSTARASSRS